MNQKPPVSNTSRTSQLSRKGWKALRAPDFSTGSSARTLLTRTRKNPAQKCEAQNLLGAIRVGASAMLIGISLVVGGCDPAVPTAGLLEVERVLGEPGTFPGQFAYPRAIDFDGQHLWVIDKSARVQQIDPNTGRAGVWWQMPDLALGKPAGITIAPATLADGTLGRAVYVADTHYHRVMVYALPETLPDKPQEIEPELLASFGSAGTEPGQFVYTTDIAVLLTSDGSRVERIYVSEYGGNDRISVFDAEYKFLFAFGTLGDGFDPAALEFSRPQSMVIDTGRKELIVADSCNHRLGRFTLDGDLLGWIGTPEPESEPTDTAVRFEFPYNLVLLNDSTVLVTEFGASRLQRVDLLRSTSLGVFGTAGRGEGELATPWGAAVDDRVTYVLDSGNSRIIVTKLPGVKAAAVERGRF